MKRKMKRRSYGRRSMFRRKYSRPYGRKRFKLTRKLYLRPPEVKYTWYTRYVEQSFTNANLSTASKQISSSNYGDIIAWPAYGTTDNTRVGDTIHPVRLWIRYTIGLTSSVTGARVRVIIFSYPTVPSGSINFWQIAVNSAIMGTPDRETVKYVYFDKIHTLNATQPSAITYAAPVDVNIKLRKPVVFASSSTTPKDPSKTLYVAVFPVLTNSVAATTTAWVDMVSHLYYTDN